MATKKVEKMLKGFAVTGASVAGASMFGDANMAFAAETGLEDTLVAQPELVVDLENTLEDNQDGEQNQIIDVELTEEDTTEGLLAQKDECEQKLQEDAELYETNGYSHAGLDEQQAIVDEKMEAEEAKRATLTDLSKDGYYAGYGDPLAVEMIKYKLLQTGMIDANNIGQLKATWYKSNYQENHVAIQYIGTDGQYHEEYFDYATADEEGNTLIQNGEKIKNISIENYAPNVYGINVLQKSPVYASTPSPNKTYSFEYTDSEGNVTTISGKRYQRTAFEEVNGSKKGVDWYKAIDYLKDIAERKQLAEEMQQLDQDIAVADAKLTLLANKAAEAETINASNTTETPAQPAPQIDLSAITILSSVTPETVAAEQAAANSTPAPAPQATVVPQSTEATEAPAAPADEVVPLAVIEEDEVAATSTGGSGELNVETGRIVDQTSIGEEEVAKARMHTIEKVGRQGLFYTIIAGIFAFFAIGKKKKDEEEEDVV